MANGDVHLKHSKRTMTLSVVPATVVMLVLPFLAFGIIAGCWSGIWITSDLDLAERRFGYWWLYGKCSRHRGRSHRLFIGTLDRWLLSWGIVFVVVIILFPVFGTVKFFIGTYLGLLLQDIVHRRVDGITRGI